MYLEYLQEQDDPIVALESHERQQLLDHVDEHHTQRVRFTVRTMLHTGMRSAEVAHMKESWLDGPEIGEDFDWEDADDWPLVRIPGREPCKCNYCRTQAERNVTRHNKKPNPGEPGYQDAVDEKLKTYWAPKSSKGNRSIPVYYKDTWELMREHLGQYGSVQVTSNALWKRVRRAGEDLEFERDLTCHALRHSFGTMFAEEEAPVDFIKRVLGHTKAETTEIYIDLAGAQVASQGAKYAPDF